MCQRDGDRIWNKSCSTSEHLVSAVRGGVKHIMQLRDSETLEEEKNDFTNHLLLLLPGYELSTSFSGKKCKSNIFPLPAEHPHSQTNIHVAACAPSSCFTTTAKLMSHNLNSCVHVLAKKKFTKRKLVGMKGHLLPLCSFPVSDRQEVSQTLKIKWKHLRALLSALDFKNYASTWIVWVLQKLCTSFLCFNAPNYPPCLNLTKQKTKYE